MRSRFVAGALVAIALLGLAVVAAAGEKWGPFRGRIVDVETGQGIEGAVVLAVWDKVFPTVAGTMSEFYDVREVVSGSDGHFEIPRRDPPFFTLNIREPDFKMFAAGYAQVRWVVTPEGGEALVDPTVIEMRKLRTREELRQKRNYYPSSKVPEDRIPEYIRAMNKERMLMGLKPIGSSEGSTK